MTASLYFMAAAREMSVNSCVLAVLSELDGILASNEEQRPELKAFLGGKDGFIKLLASPTGSLRLLRSGSKNPNFKNVFSGPFSTRLYGTYPTDLSTLPSHVSSSKLRMSLNPF